MWPAQKFNPTRRTPASSRAIMNSSTSASDGVGSPSKGHQNSTSVNPAAAAAAGRSLTGSSVSNVEQFSTNSAGEKFRFSDCAVETVFVTTTSLYFHNVEFSFWVVKVSVKVIVASVKFST